jgi:hypothetical protein
MAGDVATADGLMTPNVLLANTTYLVTFANVPSKSFLNTSVQNIPANSEHFPRSSIAK